MTEKAQEVQYSFTVREAVTMMIRAAGIHEGNWEFMVKFGVGNGVPPSFMGVESIPALVINLQSFGIQYHEGPIHPDVIVVNAAEVNPFIL